MKQQVLLDSLESRKYLAYDTMLNISRDLANLSIYQTAYVTFIPFIAYVVAILKVLIFSIGGFYRGEFEIVAKIFKRL